MTPRIEAGGEPKTVTLCIAELCPRTRLAVTAILSVIALSLLGGAFASSAQAANLTVDVYGAGSVDEVTPEDAMHCSSLSLTGTGDLGKTCVVSYGLGWVVELKPTPKDGYRFDGWVHGGTGEVRCDAREDDHCRFQMGFNNLRLGAKFVDDEPPDTTLSGGPAEGSTVRHNSASFGINSSQASSTYRCRVDNEEFRGCSDWNADVIWNLSEGPHVFEARAIDPSGNRDPSPARRTWTVDTTPPDTGFATGRADGSVTNSTSETFTFESTEANVRYECNSGAGFQSCSGPGASHQLLNLGDGNRFLEVRAVDAAGNRDQTFARRDWKVDTAAPDTEVSFGPDKTKPNPPSADFYLGATEPVLWRCSLDGAEYAPCGPTEIRPATGEYSLGGLSDGEHTLRVKAYDAAGNSDETPASWTWTVDALPPETTITSGTSGTVSSTTARFFFSSETDAAFECRIDGGTWWSGCGSGEHHHDFTEGTHTFEVAARDAVGNSDSTPAKRTWKVDTVPPSVSTVSPTSGATAVAPTANVFAKFSESVRPATVTKTTVKLVRKGTTTPVSATVTYDPALKRAKLDPSSSLIRGATYTATVTTGVKDLAGSPMATKKTWSFKVRP